MISKSICKWLDWLTGVEMKVAEHFSLQENLKAASYALPEFRPLKFYHTFKQNLTVGEGDILEFDYVIKFAGHRNRRRTEGDSHCTGI